ncbi:fatty acid desaturase 4, chloroplastic-like [Andrographis paniculata]|uniref:fatty acid desaturase 4, chloroplastic-like n=1 Tax=Andrographis paniculata TaxID=175694 RepID=UPI0021E7973E|nr:fatty acid desaturase 4, chloroplastic-like [Andrographis paniculata]
MAAVVQEEFFKATAGHRACFAGGCATIFIAIARSILFIKTPQDLLRSTLAALLGYLAADLVSGIYHWSVDNYGTAETPFLGFQIELFRVHHKQPWAVTKYDTARAVHIVAAAVAVLLLPPALAARDPAALGFLAAFGGFVMFSLQIHAWAHTAKKNIPAGVRALQDAGIILRPSWHAAHHRPPFNNTYCSVSGWCDPVLDKLKVFETMEVVLFHVAGVRPQCWSENKLRRDSGDSTIDEVEE